MTNSRAVHWEPKFDEALRSDPCLHRIQPSMESGEQIGSYTMPRLYM